LEIVRTDGNRTVELFEKMRVRIEDEAEESTGKRKIRLQLV
jgi:exosome complex exonuclease DIS3/RRP44